MFKNLDTEGLGLSARQSDVIELALSFGFKGVDLNLVDFAAQAQTHGLPQARRLLDSARLKPGAFRLPLVWDQDDDTYKQGLAGLPKLIELAAAIGCQRAVTRVAPANDDRPYHENFEFHRRRLTEIATVLAPSKIRLGLEFDAATGVRKDRAFQFIHSLDALVLLIGMVRADNVGLVADLWQIHSAGGSLNDVKKLGPERIIAVYVSDALAGDAAPADESSRTLPGETGAIDAAAALTALAEWGFDGPVTPKAHKDRFQGLRRDAIVKLAGEKLDQVWKAAGLNAAGKLGPTAAKK